MTKGAKPGRKQKRRSSAAGDDAVPEGLIVAGSLRCSLAYLVLSARSQAERVSTNLSNPSLRSHALDSDRTRSCIYGLRMVYSESELRFSLRRRLSQVQLISVTGERSDIRKLL